MRTTGNAGRRGGGLGISPCFRALTVVCFRLGVRLLQQPRAQHRRQRERDQHRDDDREGHRPPELIDVAARVSGHKRDRREDDHQAERRGHDRQRDLLRAFDRRAERVVAFLFDEAVDVFEDHDRVVNHDADRERQRQQRHVVERKIERLHQRECGDYRGRDGHGGDEHRAQVADENPDDQRGQQAAQQQVLFQRVDGGPDEDRLVARHADGEPPRQLFFDVLQLGADRVNDLDGVGPRLAADVEQDGRLAFDRGEGARLLNVVLDFAYVAEPDRRTRHVLDDDVAELGGGVDAPHRAHAHLAFAANDAASGRFDVLLADRVLDFVDRDAVCAQAFGVDVNANLALAAPAHRDLADAVNGLQNPPDLFVGDLGRLAQAAVAGHGDGHHGFGIGVGFLNDRRDDVRRQLAHRAGDLLAHVLGGVFDAAFERELDGDRRRPFGDSRAEFVNAADGRKSLFDRQRHLRDHLFRLSAGQIYADEDRRGIGLRKEIDSKVAERENPEHYQKADEHHRKYGPLYANFSKCHCVTEGSATEPPQTAIHSVAAVALWQKYNPKVLQSDLARRPPKVEPRRT